MAMENIPAITYVVAEDGRGADIEATIQSIGRQTMPPADEDIQRAGRAEPLGSGVNRVVRRSGSEFVCLTLPGTQLDPVFSEAGAFLIEMNVAGWVFAGSPAAVLLLRRQLFLQLGGYDTKLPDAAQWNDFLSRLENSGKRGSALTPAMPAVPYRSDPHSKGTAVLLAMPFLTMGGAEAIVSQLCLQLKNLGFRIYVTTTVPVMESQGDTTSWFAESVAGVYHLPPMVPQELWGTFILRVLHRHDVKIVWLVGSSFVYGMLPRIRLAFPHISVVDLLFNPVGHTENHLKYSYVIDHAVTEHAEMRNWLIEHAQSAEDISIIPNGVDLDRYAVRPRIDWRSGNPSPPDDRSCVIGFMGRLSEEKGPDIFLRMAVRLRDREDVRFLVCGTGPMREELAQYAADHGVSGRTCFAGFVRTADYLPCCDVLVVCSRLDGRPNVVMESLAMGIPVVASRVGGIEGMIPPEFREFVCEPGDDAALAAAVNKLMDDSTLRRKYRLAARAFAERNFSIADAGEAYAELFRRLVARKAARRRPISAVAGGDFLNAPGEARHPDAPPVRATLRKTLFSILTPSNAVSCFRNACVLLSILSDSSRRHELLEHFDADYYEITTSAKWGSKYLALCHYTLIGFRFGCEPNRGFDGANYLALNPDLAGSRINPLLHYLAFGRQERRIGAYPGTTVPEIDRMGQPAGSPSCKPE